MYNFSLSNIELSKKNFNEVISNNFAIRNVKVNGSKISFWCDKDCLEQLKVLNIKYKVLNQNKIKYIKLLVSKNLSFVIGVFLFILIIIGNVFTVKDIEVNLVDEEGKNIKDDIMSKLHKVGPFMFMKDNVIDLNYFLKNKYSNYEWISVNKKGNALITEVRKGKDWPQKEIENVEVGDLVAASNGLVKSYKVIKGVPLIEENLMVSEGDVLVSGNLLYHHDTSEEYLISPKGYVIAEVWEEKVIKIHKNEVINERTGKVHLEKEWNLFGFSFTTNKLNDKYENFDVVEKKKSFNILGIKVPRFSKNIYYYEKSDIIYSNDRNDAVEAGETTLYMEYKEEFKHEDEKIISIEMIDEEENNNFFYVKYLVKVCKNIAVFKRSIHNGE